LKLALECPTLMLNLIQPLADMDFILTHLVLKDKDYALYYMNSKRAKIIATIKFLFDRLFRLKSLTNFAGMILFGSSILSINNSTIQSA